MKYLIICLFLLVTTLSPAQEVSYDTWKKEAKSDFRLLPKYGGHPKSAEQKALDQKLIEDYTAQGGTRLKGSDILVKLGFDHLYRGNLKTAMYRFNQAWLLDAGNPNVYWGFGAIYTTLGELESAISQYDEGLKIDPNSSNILTDKATVYKIKYEQSQKNTDYQEALRLFKKSYAINPTYQSTLYKLSVCYFEKGDCENARKYYNECLKLGGKNISKEYTEALNSLCK